MGVMHGKDAILNPHQRDAIEYLGGPLLVLAGAGSGKTRVIAHKISYLITSAGIRADAIAAITFTQKAAREMQTRIKSLLGSRARGLVVSTFHSLGLKLLREEHRSAELRSRFSILDPESARVLIAAELARERADTNDAILAAQNRISAWKSALVSPDSVRGEPYGAAYAGYQRRLGATSAVDFDDLIALPVQLLESVPGLAERWQPRWRYLLVDEYQDTNTAQYRFLKALAGDRGAFTIVGDDDQSIYAWRGAQPENLRRLGEDYPTLKVIKLEENYRSTANILDAANALIAHNPHLYEKRLRSVTNAGKPLRVLVARDADHEAARVTAAVLDLTGRKRIPAGEIAILYRGNHQSRPFERALAEARVAYRVSGGTAWMDRSEIKDILAYLRLLANPEDDAAFLRIANIPHRDIGPGTLESLGTYAQRRDVSLFAAGFEMGLAHTLPERGHKAVTRFARLISRLAERAERESPAAITQALLETIGYRQWLDDETRDERARKRRNENLDELLAWIGRGAENLTLVERLRELAIAEYAERDSKDQDIDRMQLMTLHAAKGLEFTVVFLVGMEEGLLPHRNGIEADHIEEERRLAYVGITRTRRELYFTLTERRRHYGAWETSEPSRFLGELPKSLLTWERPDDANAEARRGHRGTNSSRIAARTVCPLTGTLGRHKPLLTLKPSDRMLVQQRRIGRSQNRRPFRLIPYLGDTDHTRPPANRTMRFPGGFSIRRCVHSRLLPRGRDNHGGSPAGMSAGRRSDHPVYSPPGVLLQVLPIGIATVVLPTCHVNQEKRQKYKKDRYRYQRQQHPREMAYKGMIVIPNHSDCSAYDHPIINELGHEVSAR